MIDIHSCPVCGGKNFTPFLECTDHSVSHETFRLLKCDACDLVITSPRPDATALGEYYISPSYISHFSTAKTVIDKVYLLARNFTLRWKLSIVKKHTSRASGLLLDYGCGTGEFLRTAKSKGWQVLGMEPSKFARQQSDQATANYIKASLQEVADTNMRFDAITLWHVLEHIDDLNFTIQKLKELLAQNGTIFIAVPNHTSEDGKVYKQYWAGYDVPRHLWHFGMKNMKILAANHGLAMNNVIPMRLDAYYVSLLSEKYKNQNSFSIKGIMNAILIGIKSNYTAKRNNEYSSLIYVLKK